MAVTRACIGHSPSSHVLAGKYAVRQGHFHSVQAAQLFVIHIGHGVVLAADLHNHIVLTVSQHSFRAATGAGVLE